MQYDSHDPTATLDGAYKDCAEQVILKGTHAWKTGRFALVQARFGRIAEWRRRLPDRRERTSLLVRKVVVERRDAR